MCKRLNSSLFVLYDMSYEGDIQCISVHHWKARTAPESDRERVCVCARGGVGVKLAHTIIVAVKTVEHEPQPLLMSLQVLGELLEVQQPVMVDVTLEDDLRGQRRTVSRSAERTDGLRWDGADRHGGGRDVQMTVCW